MEFMCPVCREVKDSVLMQELPQGVILFCDRGHSVMVRKRDAEKRRLT